ncbi:MAG: UDP-N-acetylmuramate dehydrogenase [Clostridia bacterium]|nr:UDP-N-acetylmuramate dehydrogenase [Clostridia bacterium]
MIAPFCDARGIPYARHVLLAEHTTFRIGGPADFAVMPRNPEEMGQVLSFLNKNNMRYFILGKGSDILAHDKGYRGVLVLTEGMKALSAEGDRIYAEAGCSMASVSNLALREGLRGLEFLHGIPGSIGGGIFMNAGAYGSEIGTFVESVTWADRNGVLHTTPGSELSFSYRHSFFTESGGVVCSVVLRCSHGNPVEIKEKMQDLDGRRREKQPLEYPSAGSTFKRPEGYFAGKLIEDSGLKGFSVGDAWVSEKHAGFIVNKGNATSEDVHRLINHVTSVVYQKFGVTLEPEVRFLDE